MQTSLRQLIGSIFLARRIKRSGKLATGSGRISPAIKVAADIQETAARLKRWRSLGHAFNRRLFPGCPAAL